MSRTLIALAALATTAGASAAEYCTFDEASLRAALDAAQASPEADDVRIAATSIVLTDSLTFWPSGLPAGELVMSGGWSAGCTEQSPGAHHTKLEADDPQLNVVLNTDADLTLSDLHFVNFDGVALSNQAEEPGLTTLKVSRVAVFNDQVVGDALQLFSSADRIEIDNVLVDATAGCAVAAATLDDAGELTFRSSTLIARKHASSNWAGAAICFDGAPQADLNAAYNTVFHSADGVDVVVNGRPVLMQGSAYSDIQGCGNCGVVDPLDPASSDNLVMPMAFDQTANGNLARFVRIAHATVLIPELVDSGVAQPGQQYSYDVIGNPRLSGAKIDRGAFEISSLDILFRNGFEGS